MKTHIKRTTIYLDSDVHRALRIKAAETEHSMSEVIEDAIKVSLTEDSIDLATFEQRKDEPSMAFENIVKKLRKNGKI